MFTNHKKLLICLGLTIGVSSFTNSGIKTKSFTSDSKKPFALEDVFVEEDCKIKGSGQLNYALIRGNAEILGRFVCFNSIFMKDLYVDATHWDGQWLITRSAKDTEKNEMITVDTGYEVAIIKNTVLGTFHSKADTTYISDSYLKDVKIHEKDYQVSLQKIIIEGKTVIEGDIVFASGYGQAYIGEDVVITGQIIGGELITSK